MSLTPTQLGLLSHLAAVSLLFSALLIPPSKLSHTKLALAFLPPIWACHIYSWSVGLGVLAVVQVLQATELLLFQDPREKFQVIYHQKSSPSLSLKSKGTSALESTEGSEKDQIRKEPYPINLWSRLGWVFKLFISLRYIGWDINTSSKNSQPISSFSEETKSHPRWLIQNVLLAAIYLFLFDATNAYQHLDPYFQVETAIDEPFPLPLAAFFIRHGFGFFPPPRLVRIIVLGVQQYTLCMLINRVLAIVYVSLGGLGLLDEWWSRVENWPMMMGSPFVVLTSGLRGFWGQFWHQVLRSVSFLLFINLAVILDKLVLTKVLQLFMSPAKAVVKVLKVNPKSFSAYTIKIVVAFFISGVFHAASLPFDVPGLSPLRYALFFWIHGVCVLTEVFLEHLLRGILKQKTWWTGLGASVVRFVWAIAILYTTVPMFADEITRVSRVMGLTPTLLLPLPRL